MTRWLPSSARSAGPVAPRIPGRGPPRSHASLSASSAGSGAGPGVRRSAPARRRPALREREESPPPRQPRCRSSGSGPTSRRRGLSATRGRRRRPGSAGPRSRSRRRRGRPRTSGGCGPPAGGAARCAVVWEACCSGATGTPSPDERTLASFRGGGWERAAREAVAGRGLDAGTRWSTGGSWRLLRRVR